MKLPVLLLATLLAGCAAVTAPPGPGSATPLLADSVFTARDGIALPLRHWGPLEHPHAVIIALHGMSDYANGFALGTAALLTLVIAQQHPLRSWARIFWWCMALGLVIVAANEVFDIFDRMERAWGDDDYSDLVFLCITPIGLYLACAIESAPRIAVASMKLGFLFQFLSDLIDLGDGDGQFYLYTITLFDRNLMAVLTDMSELIFIETYLFGLGCLLLHIVLRRMRLQPEHR